MGIDIAYFFKGDSRLFLKTGLRLVISKSDIMANHTVPGIAVPAISWGFGYSQISVPLYIGKSFIPFKNSDFFIDVFAGGSLGKIQTSSFYWDIKIEKNASNYEYVAANIDLPRSQDGWDSKFLPTIDVGINFPIIPSFPQLNFGILVSRNLASSAAVQKEGFVANISQSVYQTQYFRMSNTFTNVMFYLNYSMGKKWVKGLKKENRYNDPNPKRKT